MALDMQRLTGEEQAAQSGCYPERQNQFGDTDWAGVDGLGCQAGWSVLNCVGQEDLGM